MSLSGFSTIPDIIHSLKTSFFDWEFRKAEAELLAREKKIREEKENIKGSLKQNCDASEAELRELKTQKQLGEEELRRLKRDCEVNDKKLVDLTRDLVLVKQKEEKTNKRYNDLLVKFRESSLEMANLRDKLQELEGIRQKNELLQEEMAKLKVADLGEMEEIRRTKEFLKEENAKQIQGFEALLKVQGVELEGLQKKNASLEEEQSELDARCELFRKLDLEKIEKIKELTAKIEVLGREKRGNEKEMDPTKLRRVEDRISKLEQDLLTCMCFDLGKDVKFSSTQFGKILCAIETVLDSPQLALTTNTTQKSDSPFVISEDILKLDKQSEGVVKKPWIFETEISRVIKDVSKKEAAEDGIIILDSDDDCEDALHASSAKRKHDRPDSVGELDSSDDYSLSMENKKKKLEYVLKPVNHESSTLSDTAGGIKFNTPQSNTMATIRRCEEQARRVLGEPRCLGLVDNGSGKGEGINNGTNKVDKPRNID